MDENKQESKEMHTMTYRNAVPKTLYDNFKVFCLKKKYKNPIDRIREHIENDVASIKDPEPVKDR